MGQPAKEAGTYYWDNDRRTDQSPTGSVTAISIFDHDSLTLPSPQEPNTELALPHLTQAASGGAGVECLRSSTSAACHSRKRL